METEATETKDQCDKANQGLDWNFPLLLKSFKNMGIHEELLHSSRLEISNVRSWARKSLRIFLKIFIEGFYKSF